MHIYDVDIVENVKYPEIYISGMHVKDLSGMGDT